MKRKLFNLLSVLSSLLLVATMTVAWLHSEKPIAYVQNSVYIGSAPAYGYEVFSQDGRLFLYLFRADPTAPEAESHVTRWNGLGFLVGRSVKKQERGTYETLHLRIPFYAIAIAFSLLPMLWLYRQLTTRLPAPGLCPTCGYDLRASPERCPECGTVVDASIISLRS